MKVDLTDKIAMVVRGGGELEGAIARTLASLGARVAAVDSDAEAAQRLVEELGQGHVHIPVGSLSDAGTAQQATDATVAALGRVDILVSASCRPRGGTLVETSEEDWQQALDECLRSAFVFCRAVARPMMKQRSGRIILLTSAAGLIGCAGQQGFSAASGGLLGLTRTVARELAGRGLTVNCVAAGLLEDKVTSAIPEAALQAHLALVPLGRLGRPADVANVVAFLASDAAAYITGQVIPVDGGMVMG